MTPQHNHRTFTYLCFPGEPVPFQRPRVNGRTFFNSPRYDTYKRNLAAAIRTECGALMLKEPLELMLHVFRSNNKPYDLDNMIKACNDAMQDAGLIADDRWIHHIQATKGISKDNPRIEFWLSPLPTG